jgi:hypothetical protein
MSEMPGMLRSRGHLERGEILVVGDGVQDSWDGVDSRDGGESRQSRERIRIGGEGELICQLRMQLLIFVFVHRFGASMGVVSGVFPVN